MFAPTMRCGVIKVCGINNNAKRRGVGTSDFCKAEIAPLPYRFVKKCGQYSIFKLRSGCDIGYYALGCVYTKSTTHTHALTQVLYSLFQNLSSYSLSRRACTCPQVSKRFLLIPEKHPLLLHKKCNNCRNVAKLKYKSFVCINLYC